MVPLAMLASQWDTLPIDKNRHHDVFIARSETDEEIATLHLPAGYVVDELPKTTALASPAVEARLEVSSAAGTVTIKRTVQTHAGRWPRSVYPAVAAVLQGSAAWRHQTLTIHHR